MSVKRSTGTSQSLLFVKTLLLSTALALPAMAQVEEVVVTAQRKAENIQNVPIQITAFSSQDMSAHQIDMAKDLQFATPNVSYSRTNFSGDDFSIRGIGTDVVSGGGEAGVAVSFDNIYLASATLDLTSFYDIDRVEVLEGPQSTLYGRGATAGTVNIVPAKPDLEQAFVNGDASYGNYNANEDRLAVNIPIITDQLGIRIALDRNYHDGFISDLETGWKIDGDNDYSFRGTVRWEPTDSTTIDFVASSFHKDDTTMRSQRQDCLYDPSGTLGCLPNGLANDAINQNAFFGNTAGSTWGNGLTTGYPTLGLANLSVQAPEVFNPSGTWQDETDFKPIWRVDSSFLALNIVQKIANWLDFTGDLGYSNSYDLSQESYNNGAPQLLNPVLLATSEATFLALAEGAGAYTPEGGAVYAGYYSPFLTSHPGELPVSALSGLGISTNNIAYYSNAASAFDQSNAHQKQYSIDLRFLSHFSGPFNFLLGAFYLRQEGDGDYFVTGNEQTYVSLTQGALLPFKPAFADLLLQPYGLDACYVQGCTLQSVYYDQHAPSAGVTLSSKAVYGETYFDIVPDLLKLTLGARWTEDYKSEIAYNTLFSALAPFGTSSIAQLGYPVTLLNQRWDKWTGRAVLDYTPQLDFTDQTLVYASYARGYKAGGFNPGLPQYAIESGTVSETYTPEGIDAFELGTKNTLLHSTLQANFDVWYYNYEGLQVSQILDNDSVNTNISSHMYGGEGQFVWVPNEHWTFNFNIGYVHSAIGNAWQVDPRNPTAGAANAILIKDATPFPTSAQNCALYMLNASAGAPANNPVLLYYLGVDNPFLNPPGGPSVLAPYGIPTTTYGTCSAALLYTLGLSGSPVTMTDTPLLNAAGYSWTQPGGRGTSAGVPENLHGNENPNTPPWTLSLGAAYTFVLGNDYTLVPRVDMYYQTQMWGRPFEDGADKIPAYFYANAQVQFNSPDNSWYVQGFIKNIANKAYITGEYLTSSSSGLFTNEFLGDPRTYGIRVGFHF